MAKKSTRTKRPAKRTAFPQFGLENVALLECHCHRNGIVVGPMPGVVAIKLSYRADRHPEDLHQLICKLPLETTAAYSEAQEPALVLKATFAAVLRFVDPIPDDIGDEKTRNYLRNMAIFHIWPYWRQFVHSTTVSMSLPPMQMFPEVPEEMLSKFVTTS